ncbi:MULTISPECIES: LysR family transcriptional regulator [Vibrio]|uniref:LysR family transcriptional regulator n=2 Tax=Vibrio TaxID=662 RepID=A0A7X4LQ64_9VIBR|nr:MULTISPECIES: LysR family transcriptional regulator [Vibrio]MBF9000623.1 LysR family transcriptional regulator [Vibrio nitrifigilis]MZI95974.1 LysR family transcriptional regulator [Vibrio eleionomae]
MVEYISDLRLFLTISRTLNFREAGDRLGYSPAVVTTRMQRLESMTGKTLFIRSTRHIKLTEEGHQMVRYVEQLLDLSELISRSDTDPDDTSNLKGLVRVTAPHSFARIFLLKPVQLLMETHPELTIELILEDKLSKIVEEEIDICFRVGGDLEPHIDSIDLFADKRILVASPSYIEKNGAPQTIGQLNQHQCLGYPHAKFLTLFDKQQKPTRVPLSAVLTCNTGDFLRQLTVEGTGITTKSSWSICDELSSGQLVRVLPDYTVDSQRMVRALLPKRDYTPTRVTHVLNTIKAYIDQQGID